MTNLCEGSLSQLPASITQPGYDRSTVATGVIHFGPGAFHRAHQAVAFDTLLAHDQRWGITGVSLNSHGVADALTPQDGLYTLALLDAETDFRIISSIGKILTRDTRADVLAAMANQNTRVISSTVTEKGYCLDADGKLDFANPVIKADIDALRADGEFPVTFTAWLLHGLRARRRAGLPGVTIMCCDNLTDNGRKLEAATIALAQTVDGETARWIADTCAFPNAMVDSITPATDDALRQRVATAIGMDDAWPIQREFFTQWVIEDRFAGERPELEAAGVTFAKEVRPFETTKLRILNGAHSAIAYIGLARGLETVAEAMADPELAAFAERLMRDDIAPSLRTPPGFNLSAYIADVLARFANPAIRHLLSQIAWDGSQKLPYRLLDTVRDALAAGRPIDRLALPIAAWLIFLARAAKDGRTIVDPLGTLLLSKAGDWRNILAIREVFGELGGDIRFVQSVEAGFAKVENGPLS